VIAARIRRWAAGAAATLVAVSGVGCIASRAALYPGCDVPCTPAPGVDVVDYTAADGNQLRGAWVRSRGGAAAPVLLWFHGNAESAGTSVQFARALAESGCDVFLAEYRGFGGQPGRPSETGLHSDAQGALAVVSATGVTLDRLVLGGRSLGTGVAVELACHVPVRGVVLVSPYTSIVDLGRRMVGPLAPIMVCDEFASIDKVGKIDAPVVVVHGTLDETIPFEHGQAIAAAARQGTLVPVEGAGHNGIPGLERLVAEAVAKVVAQ
jgi:uncharacterized protein